MIFDILKQVWLESQIEQVIKKNFHLTM